MRNNKPTFLQAISLLLLMFFTIPLSFSQCIPVEISPSSDEVVISGLWADEGEADPERFVGYIRLKSNKDTTYSLSVTSLTDEETTASIPAENISLSSSTVTLKAGKTKEIKIEVTGVREAGHYVGTLQIVQQGEAAACFRELPMIVDVKVPGQISILDTDQSLVIKTVEKSWMMSLLPRNIRQKGIFVRVENKGPASVSFDGFSLSLKGTNTQHPISKVDVIWENPDEVIPPGGIATMRFSFTDSARDVLQPDEYSGSLRLHAKNFPSTLSVGITMFSRTGVLGALFALLLGIFVGRMLKSVNNNQEQIELMKKFVPLRDSIREVTEESTKATLLAEADLIEKQINKVKGADQAPQVEALIEPLNWKVTQIKTLDKTYAELAGKFTAKKVKMDQQAPVIEQLNKTTSAILAGDQAAVAEGYKGIRSTAEIALAGQKSRGGLDDATAIDPALEQEMKGLDSLLKQGEVKMTVPAGPVEKTFLQKFEDWFFRIFSMIGGMGASARVRYGLFRPLVGLITFLVVLMIGFQEIYLNGGDTFGSEGLYDHLKLFVWGVVSDIFSRTLTDENTVASLKGISPGA